MCFYCKKKEKKFATFLIPASDVLFNHTGVKLVNTGIFIHLNT